MPFFQVDDLPGVVVAPGHSTAYGATVTGKEIIKKRTPGREAN